MNTAKVTELINKTIEDFRNQIGGRAARKQYAPAKHQIQTLTKLGLIDLMPKGFGHGDAKVVIEAAQTSDSAIMNAYGEGEEISASALNQAINEETEEEKSYIPEYMRRQLIRWNEQEKRNQIAVRIRDIEINESALKRAKAKYPKNDSFIVTDIVHSIQLLQDEIRYIQNA